jgi:hypothetical protein
MIDYDARPVTPQLLLVGNRASSAAYSIRDFLSRNGVPYEWVDVDDARVGALLSAEEMSVESYRFASCPTESGFLRPRWKMWRQDWEWFRLRCCRTMT